MADAPFRAIGEAEQPGGGQKEQPPAPPPKFRFGAISIAQHPADRILMQIVIRQPILRRAPVMPAVPLPFDLRVEQIAEMTDQPVARHDAAGEEMLGDPVRLVTRVEAIRPAAMAEDVQEKAPVRLQP